MPGCAGCSPPAKSVAARESACSIGPTSSNGIEGLLAVLVPDEADAGCEQQLRRLAGTFGDRAYLALTLRRRPGDQMRLHKLVGLAAAAGVATVVTNDVLFHVPERRQLQDVVTCVRHGCTIDTVGFRRERHADRHLKPAKEMERLFARYPEALARTRRDCGALPLLPR